MTPSGIEPVAFRFLAQHLNHCATAAPGFYSSCFVNYIKLQLCIYYSMYMYVCIYIYQVKITLE